MIRLLLQFYLHKLSRLSFLDSTLPQATEQKCPLVLNATTSGSLEIASRINFIKSLNELFIKHSQFPLFRIGSAHDPGGTSSLLVWNHCISLQKCILLYHHSIAMETNNMPQLSGNALDMVRLTIVLNEITGLPLQVVSFVIVIAAGWNPEDVLEDVSTCVLFQHHI